MKELYYNLQTAFLDCIEYKGKSLMEWEEENNKIQKKLEEKHMHEQYTKDYEQERQENIKLYRKQADELSRYDSIGQFVDLAGEFDRSEANIDEDAQYRAEFNFATAAGIDLDE